MSFFDKVKSSLSSTKVLKTKGATLVKTLTHPELADESMRPDELISSYDEYSPTDNESDDLWDEDATF